MRLPKYYKDIFYNLYDLGVIYKSGNSRDLEYVKYDIIEGDFYEAITYIHKKGTNIGIYFPRNVDREHNMIYILLYKGDDPREGLYFSKYIALTKEMQGTEAMQKLLEDIKRFIKGE